MDFSVKWVLLFWIRFWTLDIWMWWWYRDTYYPQTSPFPKCEFLWLIFTLTHLFFKLASNHHTLIFSFVLNSFVPVDMNLMEYCANVMSLGIGNVIFCGFLPNICSMRSKKETGLHWNVSFLEISNSAYIKRFNSSNT